MAQSLCCKHPIWPASVMERSCVACLTAPRCSRPLSRLFKFFALPPHTWLALYVLASRLALPPWVRTASSCSGSSARHCPASPQRMAQHKAKQPFAYGECQLTTPHGASSETWPHKGHRARTAPSKAPHVAHCHRARAQVLWACGLRFTELRHLHTASAISMPSCT